MAPPKGSKNNPNGRPPKSRALTDLLVKELSHTIDVDGVKVSGKKIVASLVVRAITTGRLKFPKDTADSVISVKDWIEFVKWLHVHVDGSVKTELDVTTGGEPLPAATINVYLPENGRDNGN